MNQQNDEITMYSVNDISKIFGCSKNTAYAMVKIKGFPSIKLNRKIVVPKKELGIWVKANIGKDISFLQ